MLFSKSTVTHDLPCGVIVKGEEISLSYEGNTVVSGLNFEIRRGDYLCIVGNNGSGKSTLLRAMLGLKEISGGRLMISADTRVAGFGYLPQISAAEKDFPASVREVVLSGCLGKAGLRPFYSKNDKAIADSAMKRMNISELADRSYRELSGGQQQRVRLSRAYCATGEVLFLDEPVAGLDPESAAEMYRLINDMNRDGITIVMVSHDIPATESYASHVLHVGGVGGEHFFGTAKEYASRTSGGL